MKGLTSLQGLGPADLSTLVASAISYADHPHVAPELEHRIVAMLFFERSTRTRLSFELAASRLGAHVMGFDPTTASIAKGESLRDTALTISAMGADIFVVRHAEAGVPDLVAEWTGRPVVNAGDGMREHPTQALIDIVTLTRHFGGLSGLRVAIVGDISHSRVAGSLMHVLPSLGVDLTLVGPHDFLPADQGGMPATTDLDAVLPFLDVVYLLRVQTERGATITEDYTRRFSLDETRAASMRHSAMVMHPGPLNRGVEISDSVADGPRSLILSQVANGVPTRMAVLTALETDLS